MPCSSGSSTTSLRPSETWKSTCGYATATQTRSFCTECAAAQNTKKARVSRSDARAWSATWRPRAKYAMPPMLNATPTTSPANPNLPLGLGASSYPESTITLDPGTQLLFYTDGITEAMDNTDEEFGPARLIEHFHDPEACVDSLIAEVKRHGTGSTHTDDATAVLIR